MYGGLLLINHKAKMIFDFRLNIKMEYKIKWLVMTQQWKLFYSKKSIYITIIVCTYSICYLSYFFSLVKLI